MNSTSQPNPAGVTLWQKVCAVIMLLGAIQKFCDNHPPESLLIGLGMLLMSCAALVYPLTVFGRKTSASDQSTVNTSFSLPNYVMLPAMLMLLVGYGREFLLWLA